MMTTGPPSQSLYPRTSSPSASTVGEALRSAHATVMPRHPLLPPVQFNESSPAATSHYSGPGPVLAPIADSTCGPTSGSMTLPRQHSVPQRSTHTTLTHGHPRNSPSPIPLRQPSPQPHIESRRPSTYDRLAHVPSSFASPSSSSTFSSNSSTFNGGYERSGYDRRFSTDSDPTELRRSSLTASTIPMRRGSGEMRGSGQGYSAGYPVTSVGVGSAAPLQRSQPRYRIEVRQQPAAARACGFGERDRRVIDPPPIVQLIIDDPEGGPPDPAELRYPFNVVHCTLWSIDGQTDETAISGADKRTTRRLMGTLVSSPFVGFDEKGQEGCFFCFPDLSCRTHGQYRLRFKLMRLEPNNLEPNGFAPIITEALSDVFQVFTAKEFPGMRTSTALTKALKRQGCAISVKKGNDKSGGQAAAAGGGSGKDDGDGDGSGEDETPPLGGDGDSAGKPKRRRKV